MSSSTGAEHKHTNRLARETSPYLLQHAHNPVDWYAWGPEAFERARRENKPIFLSVGYSTCYWCHVMERQSFENEMIAKLMNELFVNIKVDREERPDVDQLYMTAVQILTRQGGWPMSVFLTPDLKPFFGGTYFPPADMHGRPGFPRVLQSLSHTFATKRDQVEKSADEITRMIGAVSQPRRPEHPLTVDLSLIEQLLEQSSSDFDSCFGGFGGAPKFPRETLLEALLRYARSPDATEDGQAMRRNVLYTLDCMADGGIRDHLGGGFHRYSTDEKWLVPHFEIMLYDQGMLAVCYLEAWAQTREARHARVARGILDFALREMTSPDGAFYTAFDAEVDAMEGLSYLWTLAEAREVLREKAEGDASTQHFSEADIDLFLRTYGLQDGPNFADPHHGNGQPDQNILFLPKPLEEIAKSLSLTEEALDARLAPMRQALYAARARRKQPLLDTKILTSWNGLMIRAFAMAGRLFDEPRYAAAAARAADWLLKNHWDRKRLIRTSRPDAVGSASAEIPGSLDDYAFFGRALLELYAATGDIRWKERAAFMMGVLKNEFLDAQSGGFYFTPVNQPDLIVRSRNAHDSPLPSGNSVAAICLRELGDAELARKTIAEFSAGMAEHPDGMSSMLQASLEFLEKYPAFTVSAEEDGAARVEAPESPDELARAAVALSAAWVTAKHLRITVKIDPAYHLNDHKAAEGLVPTALSVAASYTGEQGVQVQYPPGAVRPFPFAEKGLSIYEGTIAIEVMFGSSLPTGTRVRATLTYQPCTEEACLSATGKVVETIVP